jgi:hypothetical protein
MMSFFLLPARSFFSRIDSRGVRDVRSSYDERDRRIDVGRGVRDSWKDGLPQSPPIQPIEAVLGPDTPKLRLGADDGFKDGPTSPVRRPPGLEHGCLPGGVLPDTAVVLASCAVCVLLSLFKILGSVSRFRFQVARFLLDLDWGFNREAVPQPTGD